MVGSWRQSQRDLPVCEFVVLGLIEGLDQGAIQENLPTVPKGPIRWVVERLVALTMVR